MSEVTTEDNGLPSCKWCNKPVEDNDAAEWYGRRYHSACLAYIEATQDDEPDEHDDDWEDDGGTVEPEEKT